MNDEEVTFKVCKSILQPNDLQLFSFINVVDNVVASMSDVMSLGESLTVVLLNCDDEEIEDYDEVVAAFQSLESYLKTPPKLDLDLKN